MLFWTCPECGANLDLGEACEDCREKEKDKKVAAQLRGVRIVQPDCIEAAKYNSGASAIFCYNK